MENPNLGEKQVSIGVHPTYYGNGNITEAFTKKELAFELEIKTKNSVHREIITLNDVLRLQNQIKVAITCYDSFSSKG